MDLYFPKHLYIMHLKIIKVRHNQREANRSNQFLKKVSIRINKQIRLIFICKIIEQTSMISNNFNNHNKYNKMDN